MAQRFKVGDKVKHKATGEIGIVQGYYNTSQPYMVTVSAAMARTGELHEDTFILEQSRQDEAESPQQAAERGFGTIHTDKDKYPKPGSRSREQKVEDLKCQYGASSDTDNNAE